jgi:hypothetical protein
VWACAAEPFIIAFLETLLSPENPCPNGDAFGALMESRPFND